LVDLTFVTNAAQASHSAGVPYFSHVTASNSSSSSWFLYPKTKGEAEDAIKAIGFNHTTILRPGLLDRGSEARSVEKFASWFVSGTKVRLCVCLQIPVKSMFQLVWRYCSGGGCGTRHAS
jgi:hypothetical protein